MYKGLSVSDDHIFLQNNKHTFGTNFSRRDNYLFLLHLLVFFFIFDNEGVLPFQVIVKHFEYFFTKITKNYSNNFVLTPRNFAAYELIIEEMGLEEKT